MLGIRDALTRWTRGKAAAVLLIAAAVMAAPAGAQTAPEAAVDGGQQAPLARPDLMTREAVRDVLATLDDAQVRELLLAEFDRAIAEAQAVEDDGYVDDMENTFGAVRASWALKAGTLDDLSTVPVFFYRQIVGERSAWVFPLVLIVLALLFAAAFGIEWLFRRSLGGLRRQIEASRPASASGRAGWLLLRLAIDLLGLGVFVIALVAFFFVLYGGHEPIRLTAAAALSAVLMARLISVFARLVLAPEAPHLRLLPLTDHDSRTLYRRLMQLTIAGAVLIPGYDLLATLGLDPALASLFGSLTAITFGAILIAMIWHARQPVARLIEPLEASAGEPTPSDRLRQFLAASWHLFATAYVLAILIAVEVADALGVKDLSYPGIGSLLVVVVVPLLAAGAIHLSDQFWHSRRTFDEGTQASYVRLSRQCIYAASVLLAVVALAQLWGINPFSLTRGGLAGEVVDAVLEIGLITLLAYAGWVVVRTAIDQKLAAEGEASEQHGEAGGEGGGPGASRLRTLLPLLRTFIFVTILVMATMIVLSSLGVNIGPLLAGAGVVGLALGFGAQTLVKDIVSGVFFLVDDAFRLGEYIDIGEVRGTVEKISIRSLRLRHHRGALHTIPYGEIRHLTNHSRDWVIMKLEFRVPYDTDLTKVKKIFKRIGADLKADPVMGPNLIDTFKSQGVLRMEDSGMVLRGKFMAKPGEQFIIRREVFQRVQKAFEENDIPFARPQVSVYVPPSSGGEEPPSEAVAQAAAAAAARPATAKSA